MALRSLPSRLKSFDTTTAKVPEKQADPHYGTPEHKRWRAAVIARAHGRCQAPGCTERGFYADHIVELRDGGAPLDVANGQALCARHHTLKTNASRARRLGRAPEPSRTGPIGAAGR